MKRAEAAPAPAAEPGAMVETTVGEFLGLTDAEMRVIDVKVSLVAALRERRRAAKLTQAALAERLGVAQPRVVELERGGPGLSVDALLLAFFAVGGTGADLARIAAGLDELAAR